MPATAELRRNDIAIPARPDVLVKLSLLMADDDVDQRAISALVESDMALAAAVLKAVNTSHYGLAGRALSVHHAATYLGAREIAGITFEIGLRAVFPPAPELEPIWTRAGQRGLAMGQLGQALGLDAWAAHSAGLFEECGKAVLFAHASDHYRAMLRATACDSDLCALEQAGFGVRHDTLGAALCQSWGLADAAVACVRHHVEAQACALLPQAGASRALLAVSVLSQALLGSVPQAVDDVAAQIAPQMGWDMTLVLRAVRRVETLLEGQLGQGGQRRH